MASIALSVVGCIDYLAYGTIFTHAMFLPKIKLDVFFPARKAVDACREVVRGGPEEEYYYILRPRVWRGHHWVSTRDWNLMLNSSSSLTGVWKHTHTPTPSELVFLGYAGVAVVGAMLRWNAFWSIKVYISGDITAPAHPFTGDWGHGIFLSAFAKWLRSSQMLKKLGCGLMLGGFAKSVRTVVLD